MSAQAEVSLQVQAERVVDPETGEIAVELLDFDEALALTSRIKGHVGLEVLREPLDNVDFDEVEQFPQEHVEAFFRAGRVLWRRYAQGEIESHLHLRLRSGPAWCWIRRALCGADLSPSGREVGGTGGMNAVSPKVSVSPTDERRYGPVFVESVEFMDDPQRMPRRVRSAKWLQPLDLCNGPRVGYALNLPEATTTGGRALFGSLEVAGFVQEDRKFRVVRRYVVTTRECPYEVVENASEVVDAIASERSPQANGRPSYPNDVADVVPLIGDDVQGMWLLRGEAVDAGVEHVQVLFRPIKFDPYVI